MKMSKILTYISLEIDMAPAVIETEEELDFLREGQKSFTDSTPYFLGGSTDYQRGSSIPYANYSVHDLGIISLLILLPSSSILKCRTFDRFHFWMLGLFE